VIDSGKIDKNANSAPWRTCLSSSETIFYDYYASGAIKKAAYSSGGWVEYSVYGILLQMNLFLD